jgi:hypothetical protein
MKRWTGEPWLPEFWYDQRTPLTTRLCFSSAKLWSTLAQASSKVFGSSSLTIALNAAGCSPSTKALQVCFGLNKIWICGRWFNRSALSPHNSWQVARQIHQWRYILLGYSQMGTSRTSASPLHFKSLTASSSKVQPEVLKLLTCSRAAEQQSPQLDPLQRTYFANPAPPNESTYFLIDWQVLD